MVNPYGHNPNAMFKIFDLLKVNSKLYNKLNTEFIWKLLKMF